MSLTLHELAPPSPSPPALTAAWKGNNLKSFRTNVQV